MEVLQVSHNVVLFKGLPEKERVVLKIKPAPDMGNYVAKRYLLEMVSGLSQGVLGLKKCCAQQSNCNSKVMEVQDGQMTSTLVDGVLEFKKLCSNYSTCNTKLLELLSTRVAFIHDDVLKLVHCQNIGSFADLSNYVDMHPSCLGSENTDDDSETILETKGIHGEKRKHHLYLLWKERQKKRMNI